MLDLQDTIMSITHDGYLKLYQLSKPDLSERFKAILLDDGKDVNPVIAYLVKIQAAVGTAFTCRPYSDPKIYVKANKSTWGRRKGEIYYSFWATD